MVKTNSAPRFRVGDRVIYTAWDGTRKVTVVETNHDEKDGRRVYDLACGNWAYDYQLEHTLATK